MQAQRTGGPGVGATRLRRAGTSEVSLTADIQDTLGAQVFQREGHGGPAIRAEPFQPLGRGGEAGRAPPPVPPSRPLGSGSSGSSGSSFGGRANNFLRSVRFSLKPGNNQAPLPNMPPPEDGYADPNPNRLTLGRNMLPAGFGRRLSANFGAGPGGAGFRQSVRQSLRMGPLRNEDGTFVYAFDDPNAGNDGDDSDTEVDVTDDGGSTFSANANAAETGAGNRIKGGIKGAGSATMGPVKNRHICERLFIAALAVSVLWVTSFALARFIVLKYIKTPGFETVRGGNNGAYDTAIQEQNAYITCVESVASTCQKDYDFLVDKELVRVDQVKVANEEAIARLALSVNFAELRYNETIEALNALQTDPLFKLTDYATESSDDSCKVIEGLVAGEDAAIQALASANKFKSDADKAVQTRAQYIAAREVYNHNYKEQKAAQYRAFGDKIKFAYENPDVIYARLNASFTAFSGCVVKDGTCGDGSRPSLYDRVQANMDEFNAKFTNMKDEAIAYKTNAEREIKRYKDFLISMQGTVLEVISNDLAGYEVPEPSEAETPSQLDRINDISLDGIPGASGVMSGIEGALGSVTDKLGLENEKANQENEEFEESVDGVSTWDTYDPPPVETNNTVEDYEAAAANFIPNLSDSLKRLTLVANEEGGATGFISNSSISLTESGQEVYVNLRNHSEYGFYAYDSSIINSVTTGIDDITNLLITFDIAFRILQTLFIIRKYWNISGLSTPPGDARVKAQSGNGWGPKQTPMAKMAALLTNPLVLLLLATITTSTLLYIFWYMYSPLYFEYVNGCVEADIYKINQGEATGTMAYRNGFTVLYQFAASKGDKLANEYVDTLNLGRNTMCSEASLNDTLVVNRHVEEYNALKERLFQAINRRNAIVDCLELVEIDDDFNSNLVELTSHDSFTDDHSPPDLTGIYNCSAVTSCQRIRLDDDALDAEPVAHRTCAGPNEMILKQATHEAACTSENYLHASIFGSFLIVATYTLMNIGRYFFMRGIVRVAWRHIVSGPFSFLGSCTDTGNIVYPEIVQEKGYTMRKAIKEAVRKRIRTWERWGILILISGLLINAPWIWGIHFLSKNLDYQS